MTNRKDFGDEVIWWLRERCGKSEEVHSAMKSDLAGDNAVRTVRRQRRLVACLLLIIKPSWDRMAAAASSIDAALGMRF